MAIIYTDISINNSIYTYNNTDTGKLKVIKYICLCLVAFTLRVPDMSSFDEVDDAEPETETGVDRTYTEKDYTLVFCMRDDGENKRSVLLGMKKRGFGTGKWYYLRLTILKGSSNNKRTT